jgi:hypothetical protein
LTAAITFDSMPADLRRATKMKSFLAVLAGLVFTVLVSVGLDGVMHSTGVFPESSLEKVPEMTTAQWLIADAVT